MINSVVSSIQADSNRMEDAEHLLMTHSLQKKVDLSSNFSVEKSDQFMH